MTGWHRGGSRWWGGALLVCVAFCYTSGEARAQEAEPGPTPELEIQLTVAAALVRDLVPLKRRQYEEAALDKLFSRMRRLSRPYCEMVVFERKELDVGLVTKFVNPDRFELWEKGCYACKWDVMAGCYNFFRMNDREPTASFELIKQLYPAEQYDCYSVGFMQPYMMHNVMGCRALSMVDFDWRIHDAHRQLLELFRDGALDQPRKGLDEALRAVTLAWIAQRKPYLYRESASIDHLCTPDQHGMCVDHIRRFQNNWTRVEKIQLNLAPLHQAALFEGVAGTPRVFFMSNAAEPAYTSTRELERALTRIAKELDNGEPAILIHHVGSSTKFALYELHPSGDGFEVKTRCRDKFYKTSLDRLSTSRGKHQRCHEMLARSDG